MQGSVATLLDSGEKLHLQHGPIDLIIGVDGENKDDRLHAFGLAAKRFESILTGLTTELHYLRMELGKKDWVPQDPVAKRMVIATSSFYNGNFLTPMIAVAGSIADEILESILKLKTIKRAYVNNGGDIALHLSKGQKFSIAIMNIKRQKLGKITISADDNIKGIATSGASGRSHTFGIADSVTALAESAAQADVAATLIANEINLPDHPKIERTPAIKLQPDSDLGNRKVVTHVPKLNKSEINQALTYGKVYANLLIESEKITSAVLFLQNQHCIVGEKYFEI